MNALSKAWANKFRDSLNRSSIVSASRWAEAYRIMSGDFAGPWSFHDFPWLKEMHDSQAPYNIGQKGAQLGYTELLMNIAFYQMDIHSRDVLYILPNTRPVATDFSSSRVDKAIELSPHLKGMFDSSNVGLKVAGASNLYIRGANSRSGLKSIPAGIMLFDEFDEMPEDMVSLAEERASGQKFTLDWKISTPTIPESGINALFETSTQEHYEFRCPHCSKFIELTFPDNIVIPVDDENDPKIVNTHLICHLCKNILHHEAKHEYLKTAQWIPRNPDRLTRGFHVNQMYSPALQPYKIAKLYLKSLRDAASEQEFFNSKMGMPHLVAGAKITDEMIAELIKDYGMHAGCRSNYLVTMGIDVGKQLHIHIDGWDLTKCNPLDVNANAVCQTLWVGTERDFSELDKYMINYSVKFAVIDAMPETRAALEFCRRFNGRARACRFNHNIAARSVVPGKDEHGDDIYVSIHRTAWLDCSMGRYRNRSIVLPNNLPHDYKDHIKAVVRVPRKDAEGQTVYRYETQGSRADHYAFARVYSEVALPFAMSNNVTLNINKPV